MQNNNIIWNLHAFLYKKCSTKRFYMLSAIILLAQPFAFSATTPTNYHNIFYIITS